LFPSDQDARDQLRQANDQLTALREAEAAARAEAERLAAEEAARKKAEEEAKRKAEEEERRRAAALEEQFSNAMNAGDAAMVSGDFKTAVEQFELAFELKPENAAVNSKLAEADAQWEVQREELAKQRRIAEAKRRMQEEEERRKRAELEEKRRQERIRRLEENSPAGLAKRFPEGLTEEETDQGYRVIKKTVIVENGLGRQLFEIKYPWGLKLHYINGKRITSDTYYHHINSYKENH
jgi:dTMP kinase